ETGSPSFHPLAIPGLGSFSPAALRGQKPFRWGRGLGVGRAVLGRSWKSLCRDEVSGVHDAPSLLDGGEYTCPLRPRGSLVSLRIPFPGREEPWTDREHTYSCLRLCHYHGTLSTGPSSKSQLPNLFRVVVRRSQNPFLPQIPSLFFFSPLGRFCLPRLDIGAGLGGAPQQLCRDVSDGPHTFLFASAAVQHERGPRTSTIRKQVALYFRGHKEENGAAAHFPSAALPAPAFFTAVTQLEPHGLELAAVSTTPERQTLVSLAQPTPKYPHEVNGTPMYLYEVATESVCESAARLLFMSIKWAKSVPAFSTLSLQDQLMLLEDAWRELFVLGIAQWAIPVDANTLLAVSGMNGDNTDSQKLNKIISEIQALQEVVARFRQLRLDATEFACLKCIVTFKAVPTHSGSELRSFRNAAAIAALQDEAQLTLNSYIHTRYPTQPCRFGKLLLLLPALRSISPSTIEEVFFKKTIGNVPITRLLSDMYKSSDI
uniref:Nuclear receptor subfamily 2 group E member 1 n=1 Tax=Papio anubis TaxID=9555 RepID=A0A8I5R539_PAPAN